MNSTLSLDGGGENDDIVSIQADTHLYFSRRQRRQIACITYGFEDAVKGQLP